MSEASEKPNQGEAFIKSQEEVQRKCYNPGEGKIRSIA